MRCKVQKQKNISIFATIGLILLIISFASPVLAEEYYVRSDGNDNANGLSDATAWATISRVQSSVRNGDTVFFRSQDTWNVTGKFPWPMSVSGVTYDGASYGTGRRATIRRTDAGGSNWMMIVINTSNIRISGFDLDMNETNTSGICIGWTAPSDISNITITDSRIHDSYVPSGSYNYGLHIGRSGTNSVVSDVTITDTDIWNTGHEAFALYPSDGNNKQIRDITVRNCKAWGAGINGCSWGDGFYITNIATNVLLENCEAYNNCWGVRISNKTDGGGPNNVTVRYSQIHDNTSGNLVVGPNYDTTPMSGNILIHNNIIYSGSNYGVRVLRNLTGINLRFFNNTFYHDANSTVSFEFYNITASGTPIELKNNIINSTRNYCLRFNSNADEALVDHSNNLIFRNDRTSAWVYINGSTYDQTWVKSTWDATAQNTDPIITTDGEPDFVIKEGSAAIDNGTDLSAYISQDYFGSTITEETVFDIGAHQFDGVYIPSLSRVRNLRVVYKGIQVTGVSSSSNDGNLPDNTIDNDPNTRWSADGVDEWIEFDLGAEHILKYAMIAFYLGDQRSASFRIQVSNDRNNWQDAFYGSSSGTSLQQERFDFVSDMSGRYVRFIGLGNTLNNWNSIIEFDVF